MEEDKISVIDLFAGSGGFSCALHQSQAFETVFANDICPNTKKIFDLNFDTKLTLGDINSVTEAPPFEVLTAGFPCFPRNTKVLTAEGYRNIQDVSAQDTLLTHRGRYQRIVNLQRKYYTGKMFTITVGGNSVSATSEHPFYVKRGDVLSWVPARDLKIGDYVAIPINTKQVVPEMTEDECHRLGTQLATSDPSDVIPEWLYDAPEVYIKSFADGFLKAGQPTPTLKLGVQRLLAKIGMALSFDGHLLTQGTYMFDDNYLWRQIDAINNEPVMNTLVYNFEVEEDNTYCVENIIVHNCQPFSIAGKQLGFRDPRANVFWRMLDFIEVFQPRVCIFENVKNLVTHDAGNTFKTIQDSLTDLGYHLKHKILDTAKITDIPHHRERIYIVAFKNRDDYEQFNFDFPTQQLRPLRDLICDSAPDNYYYDGRFKSWETIDSQVVKPIQDNVLYQYRRYYVRENKNNLCPTLTANMGSGGHNVPLLRDARGVRKLTPRECFNLQGFPEDYKLPNISDSGLYKLAGNAISVPVVELIGSKLADILRQ